MIFFHSNTVCFYWLPVTSPLLPPHARDLGTLWGVAASVRGSIQHPVFSNLWPPMRGDWGAVWGSRTHKLTPCMYVPSYECVCSLPHARNPVRWLVERGHVNKVMTYPMLMRHVTLSNNSPIVSLALWLVTPVISHVHYYGRASRRVNFSTFGFFTRW